MLRSCLWQRWKGELERRYVLHRARFLHDAYATHQDKPTAPVPAFLQERVTTGEALPEVEVVEGQQEGQQIGSSGQMKELRSKASTTQQEEEERHAVLTYVMRRSNEQLFAELMQGFHAQGMNTEAMAADDGSDI